MSRTTARAKVSLTLEVDADSTWGPETSLTQVYDQGSRDAVGRLEAAIGKLPGFRILKDSIRGSAVIVTKGD